MGDRMFLTIFLGIMAAVFTWLTKLQGRQNLFRAVINAALGLLCLAWAAYRIWTGQHPVSHPTLLTDKQIDHLATLPPELFMAIGVAGLITAVLVWAIYDAASRPHL